MATTVDKRWLIPTFIAFGALFLAGAQSVMSHEGDALPDLGVDDAPFGLVAWGAQAPSDLRLDDDGCVPRDPLVVAPLRAASVNLCYSANQVVRAYSSPIELTQPRVRIRFDGIPDARHARGFLDDQYGVPAEDQRLDRKNPWFTSIRWAGSALRACFWAAADGQYWLEYSEVAWWEVPERPPLRINTFEHDQDDELAALGLEPPPVDEPTRGGPPPEGMCGDLGGRDYQIY